MSSTDRRYTLLDFDGVLPDDPGPRHRPPADWTPDGNGLRIPVGHRHPYLLSKAGVLVRGGLSRDAIAAAIEAENADRCDPPLPDDEVRTLVDDLTRRYQPDPYTRLVDQVAARQAPAKPVAGLEPLDDAVQVAADGQAIAERGIKYVVDKLVPDYGELGMTVAFSKTGKTTLSQAMGGAVAGGQAFLGRATQQRRVLALAVEDPPEYTAWLARHLTVPEGAMTFYRGPLQLDAEGLARITATVQAGGYGLVLIASWQAVVAGLVRDENDNAGAVVVVERVKAATRACGIPWLIDAHSGKGEDQSDEADPTRALRGASAAAGAADFMLSLRYAGNPFSSRRRLSGKGRFVGLEPILIDYDADTGLYTALGDPTSALRETTWRVIVETGALTDTWLAAGALAVRAGLAPTAGDVSRTVRRQVAAALTGRDGVDRQTITWRGRTVTQYRRGGGES